MTHRVIFPPADYWTTDRSPTMSHKEVETPPGPTLFECGDCSNDVVLHHVDGTTHVVLLHDSTCPWLAAQRKRSPT